MRYKTFGTAVFALLYVVSLSLGQVDARDNPFPDVFNRSRSVTPFDDQAPKTPLSGVITEAATRIKSNYRYFRMAVADTSAPNGVAIWAVLLWGSDAEVAMLKPGVYVTVLATPTKDGSRRVELVQTDRSNSLGLKNLTVNTQ